VAGLWLAESLPFLFQAHGFRGKARFVLFVCCTCEGSRTINCLGKAKKYEPIFLFRNRELDGNSSDSQSGKKFRDDRPRHQRIIKG
jgi:hypothetical protein